MWLTNVIYSDKVVENEQLKLSDRDGLYYLGPNLTFRNCTLVLKVPTKRLLLIQPRFIDCTIEVKQELKNLRWYDAHLKGCRFTGRLSGCDFGSWPDEPDKGSIEDCDFSGAVLNGCRFFGCDVNTLKFPPWPCFTILDPVRRLDELAKVPWPGRVGILVDTLEGTWVETAALTLSATIFGKKFGATEEEIKAALKHLDGVRY